MYNQKDRKTKRMKKLLSLLFLIGFSAMADQVAKDPSDNWVPLNVDANGNLRAVQAAGSAIIGKVGIDQTTDGTTNKTQSNIQIGNTAVSATNPVPVYGLGVAVTVSTTRPADTVAYTAFDVCGESPVAANMSFAGVARRAGAGVVITGASMRVDVNAVPSGMSAFRLHLFNAAPTAILDNAAYNLIAADRSKYLGFIEIPTPIDQGDTLWGQVDNANLKRDLANGSTTLYGVLQTVGGYTPSASAVKTVTIYVMEL